MVRIFQTVVVLLLTTAIPMVAQLPPEILVDRYLLQAEQRQAQGNHYGALESLQKALDLQKEHGLTLPDEFHFQHAQVSFSAGEVQAALEAVKKYLTLVGRKGEHYRDALRLLDSAEEKLQQIEAERKKREAERRRIEALHKEHTDQVERQIAAARVRLARDPMRSGGFGPEMVRVQEGQFQYATWRKDERYGSVRVSPWVSLEKTFAISKHEVTLGEFKRFVKASRYRPDSERSGCGRSSGIVRDSAKSSWKRPGFKQAENHPVVCVSRRDAMAYATWLSRETGRSYRLPSVVEWQYAARAGSQWAMLDLGFGDLDDWKAKGWTNHCGRANLQEASGEVHAHARCLDGVKRTAPVGSFPPNGIGIHDMIGNVWEWVPTCYESKGELPSQNRNGGTENCKGETIVGGGFYHQGTPGFLTSYQATYYVRTDKYRSKSSVGFRVVKDLEADPAPK